MSGVPPDPVAQAVALQFCAPARFQYTVFGAGNVMPVLPPQSPARVSDAPDAAPARLMSRKSQSVAEMALTVRVRGVPMVSERKKMRRTADAPAQVSVPLIVWSAENMKFIKPAGAGAVQVKLLNVFKPVIELLVGDVPVKDTLWNVFPPPARVLVADVNCIKEVPALKVKFVDVGKASTVPLDVKFIVLAPRLIVLTLLLLDDKTPAVTAYPAVVNVPFVTVSVFDPMFNASAS